MLTFPKFVTRKHSYFFFFFLNVKFDVSVRSRSVNLHARDKLRQSVHLQLHISQHMFALSETESKALFRYEVLLAVYESEICQAGLHEICC